MSIRVVLVGFYYLHRYSECGPLYRITLCLHKSSNNNQMNQLIIMLCAILIIKVHYGTRNITFYTLYQKVQCPNDLPNRTYVFTPPLSPILVVNGLSFFQMQILPNIFCHKLRNENLDKCIRVKKVAIMPTNHYQAGNTFSKQ